MANTIIGRVLATEKNPTTIDNFTFWTDPELILNPFDIVKVQHVNNSGYRRHCTYHRCCKFSDQFYLKRFWRCKC